ncbi:MAG: FecR domain-containing protein [Sanguibacteroides justesenii]|jgi:putative uncharacterized protein (fragment)|uniref:FecR domain-containing protein n=1 Tax=Butyricimonas faecalis TaxID=2093856 RepID=UPI001DEC0155|nr:FecR domain-containing protein [Sanguibacteroides justesenii]
MEEIDPRIKSIIYRYLCGELSESEQTILESWLCEKSHRELLQRICDGERILEKSFYFDRLDKGRERTWGRLKRATGLHQRAVLRRWIVAASLFIPFLWCGLYWNVFQFSSEMSDHQQTKIAPGISVAQLCLPDGNVINLDKDKIYNLQLSEGGRFVNEQGVLTYEGGNSKMNVIQYNEIWIPRGGEYKLVLPDGTIVWLNAESSLRFPTSFTDNERKVYAKGELYFDVKHDEVKPFIVDVERGYTIRVLGTEFNLRAYDDSPVVTTLVEGCVQVWSASDSVLLSPGQQALEMSGNHGIEVLDVDVVPYVAWHEGKFHFVRTPLKDIMEELARWYDVEVVFENPTVREECFTIEMQRFDDFNKVLRLIERTGMVTISVEAHTVTIK